MPTSRDLRRWAGRGGVIATGRAVMVVTASAHTRGCVPLWSQAHAAVGLRLDAISQDWRTGEYPCPSRVSSNVCLLTTLYSHKTRASSWSCHEPRHVERLWKRTSRTTNVSLLRVEVVTGSIHCSGADIRIAPVKRRNEDTMWLIPLDPDRGMNTTSEMPTSGLLAILGGQLFYPPLLWAKIVPFIRTYTVQTTTAPPDTSRQSWRESLVDIWPSARTQKVVRRGPT